MALLGTINRIFSLGIREEDMTTKYEGGTDPNAVKRIVSSLEDVISIHRTRLGFEGIHPLKLTSEQREDEMGGAIRKDSAWQKLANGLLSSLDPGLDPEPLLPKITVISWG